MPWTISSSRMVRLVTFELTASASAGQRSVFYSVQSRILKMLAWLSRVIG